MLTDHRDYLADHTAIRHKVLLSLRRGEMKEDILENHAALVAWCNSDVTIAPTGFLEPARLSFPVIEDVIQELCLRYAVGEVR